MSILDNVLGNTKPPNVDELEESSTWNVNDLILWNEPDAGMFMYAITYRKSSGSYWDCSVIYDKFNEYQAGNYIALKEDYSFNKNVKHMYQGEWWVRKDGVKTLYAMDGSKVLASKHATARWIKSAFNKNDLLRNKKTFELTDDLPEWYLL